MDFRSAKPLSAFKLLERFLPRGWVSRIAPYSLFWAFCVGSHGFAGSSLANKSNPWLDLLILEHTLEGRIHVLEVDVFAVLTESKSKPIRRRIDWLGHRTEGVMLSRTVDGLGLLSKGHSCDSIAWALDNNGFIRQRTILPFKQTCLSVTLACWYLLFFVRRLKAKRSSILSCALRKRPGIVVFAGAPARKLHSLKIETTGNFFVFCNFHERPTMGKFESFLL